VDEGMEGGMDANIEGRRTIKTNASGKRVHRILCNCLLS
jgi:hypothetical protein